MRQLRALAYADLRAFVNAARTIRRSPGRLVLWIFYAVLLALLFASRWLGRHLHRGGSADLARADIFVCLLIGAFAFGLTTGRGATAIFDSRTEARFIIGSPVRPALAIAYLQTRQAFARASRALATFLYLIFVFGPRRVGALTVASDIVTIIAMLAAMIVVVVPRRLAPRPAALACMALGVPLGAGAVLVALRSALSGIPIDLPPAIARLVTVTPAWHPGALLLEPHPLLLMVVIAVAAAAIGLCASAGADAFPELYALSVTQIDRSEHRRRRAPEPAAALPAAQRRAGAKLPVPRGVLVFVWASAIAFTRARRAWWIAGGAAGWCAAGVLLARVVGRDRELQFTALGISVNFLLVLSISASQSIARELRRPLFWLSSAELFERLCALAVSNVWRSIFTLECIAAGFALGGGAPLDTLAVALDLAALVALFGCVGLCAAAVFPRIADVRGPVLLLRMGVSVVLLIPPLLVFVSATAVGLTAVALGATALLAVIEGGALIGIAAWRMSGRLDHYAG